MSAALSGSPIRGRPRSRVALAFTPFVAAALVHITALVLVEAGWARGEFAATSKVFLMPALLLAFLGVLVGRRAWPRSRTIAIGGSLGIVFSWAGDVLLGTPGGLGFLLGLGAFLLAHVAYLALIVGRLRVRRVPVAALGYAVWWVAFVVILAPHTGVLLVPVAAYGLVLGGVAVFALAANRTLAVGALAFVVSDSLLGLELFVEVFSPWQIDAVIMVFYLLGQGLIALGILAYTRRETAPAS